MAATGLGYEFPDYALPEEKEEALRSCYTFKSVWGHHPGDYEKLLRVGVKGLREEIYAKLREEAAKPGCDAGKIDYYRAMLISINSLNDLSYRYAQLTLDEAAKTVDSVRRQELLTISEICNRVPENPASSLHEALQSVFFMMCALQSTLEIVPLGRVDQYLYPYYILQKPSKYTLVLLIRQFFGGADSAQNMHGAAAAAVLCVLPLIVAYLCLQKYFIQGQVDSAVK